MNQVARRGRRRTGVSEPNSAATLEVGNAPCRTHQALHRPCSIAGRFIPQVRQVLVWDNPFHPNAFAEGVILAPPPYDVYDCGSRVIMLISIGTEPNCPSLPELPAAL